MAGHHGERAEAEVRADHEEEDGGRLAPPLLRRPRWTSSVSRCRYS